MYIFFVICAFLLFILYDLNQVLWKMKFMKFFFLLGTIILILSTLSLIYYHLIKIEFTMLKILVGFIIILTFSTLLHTLFVILPFKATYYIQYERRLIYKDKLYKLNRHPGVIWFNFTFVFLMILLNSKVIVVYSLVAIVSNIIYVTVQDIYIYPKLFIDYDEYKNEVPFLIPTKESIMNTINSYNDDKNIELKKNT